MGKRIRESVAKGVLTYLLFVTLFLEALFPDLSEEMDGFGQKCQEKLETIQA